ncbi:MAG: hypothetical protein QF486_02835 [Candidatus Woesearchaeota archaeon]|jgi:hypothetical protein|nr:hypothetical protein [Candidatus Woesearchaeota archaeon]MDP7181490.1 hypothetical protein [Candidatus Woesearchaeota archaeon]MDP7198532.1 hypothetical protein [Candidatus Woesearchaeota archaeon]MDP7466726.1 hypothetical protein [Candidatus Woesearchaeota archaeon]MDP7647172.1 hypothetical protein [Candidatus Woesearchaeota archaeon]
MKKRYLLLLLLVACGQLLENLEPAEVGELYYNAIGQRQYTTSYALLSSDYKAANEHAKTMAKFTEEAESLLKTEGSLRVMGVQELTNDGVDAIIDVRIRRQWKSTQAVTVHLHREGKMWLITNVRAR